MLATTTARRLAEVVVTEAGFGADLGAEKFVDIKARYADVAPSAAVLVATVRALKMHGGAPKDRLGEPDAAAVARGTANLARHVATVRKLGLEPIVAVNRFTADTPGELDAILDRCRGAGLRAAVADVWGRGGGGDGGDELAREVLAALESPGTCRPLYPLEATIEEKILTIVREVYGAPASSSRSEPADSSRRSATTAGTDSPSAWRRHSIRSRTTPRGSGPPRASPCTSASCGPARARASSWP